MKTRLMALALAATALTVGGAKANSVAALVGDKGIAIVDAAALTAAPVVTVTGIDAPLVGIDVRPSDGMLYGVTADGTVVTIDPASGAASVKSKLETFLAAGVRATVDFNPVADKLRIIGTDGTNLRADVETGKVTVDGKLAFAEGDMHKGEAPNIVAGAYTNSMAGAKETALLNIDGTIAGLIRQAPPNDGVLSAVGKLGVSAGAYAFDIVAGAGGANQGFLMADDMLHSVDLATGMATAIGKVSGVSAPVRDIAALPAG